VASKTAISNNVTENVWAMIKKDFDSLAWVTEKDGAQKQWFFEKSDGSYSWDNNTLFWTGFGSKLNKMEGFIKKMIKSDVTAKSLHSNSLLSKPASILKRSFSSTARVGLIGARGYVGQELIQLIDKHPHMELAAVSSRENNGKPCSFYTKSSLIYCNLTADQISEIPDIHVWILALPNGVAKPFVDALLRLENVPVIIDLGADYRFSNDWLYGLPELYGVREKFAEKPKMISNPGCYATGSQLAMAPLILQNLATQGGTVFGISGFSGAGTIPSRKNSMIELKDNIMPYSLTGHIHEKEISHHLASKIAFMPHVASFFRGISLTISIPLQKSITTQSVKEIYEEYYRDELLVKVKEDIPEVRDIFKKDHVEIGGFNVSGRRLALIATIDNLRKGAATQAMQNINLAMGFDEYDGILIKTSS
jgi:N-acetyl-gamma-glutamyl-phosphate reductase/acetylglutamate kinase